VKIRLQKDIDLIENKIKISENGKTFPEYAMLHLLDMRATKAALEEC